ncbi:MAG: effector binding domain-containing protein [Ectothiorhodospiraceae bacterium]|nr:effector binding domain-containing protein [Ectothiorhodospiraceae bacterium]
MNYLLQVQKGIDYIESQLDSDIALRKVASEAGLSQWHFQRIFKALTNETLKTYIRSRRLSGALNKLISSNERIIDISIAAGFESQESFTRAFKNTFDVTPNEARKMANKNMFINKIEFDAEYLKHINQGVSLTPEIYTQKEMLLVGVKTEFYSVDSEKNNMADKLPLLWNEFLPRVNDISDKVPDLGYGIVRQTQDKTDLLEYYAACEVTQLNEIPKGMVSITIPQCRYAKFSHNGNVNKINNTVNYIYSSWLLQSGERHSYGPDIEIYGHEYVPDSDDSTIYYAIPLA